MAGSSTVTPAARWATALLDVLLPRRDVDGPVLLACDERAAASAAAALGLAPGAGSDELAMAVVAGGGLPAAARSALEFAGRPRPRPVPEHLAALALLVIAASHMGERDGIATQAYYARLAALIGPPERRGNPPYRGFGELCEVGFAALADWLADDEQGARGELWLDPGSKPRWVSQPIAQAALRGSDRHRLDTFFAERTDELDAGWDPAGSLLHHTVRRKLTKPAREMLADPRRRGLLSTALEAARASWRTDRLRAEGDLDRPPRPQATLLALVDPAGETLRLALRVEGFDDELPARGPDGSTVVVPPAPRTLEVPLEWLEHATEGPASLRLADGRTLQALSGPTMLFRAGPLGLQQAFSPDLESAWALTCLPEIAGESVPVGLPGRWRLLTDVDPATVPGAGAPAPSSPPSSSLRIVRGLPLADGVWFAAPVMVAGPPGALLLDGRRVGRLDEEAGTVVVDLSDHEGTVTFEAGESRLDVVVAVRGTRRGHGSLRWRLDHPARAATGPADRHPRGTAPTLAGAVLDGDPAALLGRERGPWCRLHGTVWALRADGSHQVVRSPSPEPWQEALGYGLGSRWRLPAGTVWACQPQRQVVQLVDPEAAASAPDADVAIAAALCLDARALDDGAAEARYRRAVTRASGGGHD